MSNSPQTLHEPGDEAALAAMVRIAQDAGAKLLASFIPTTRPDGLDELIAAVGRNEEVASVGLVDALAAVRPSAVFLDDSREAGDLSEIECWVVDAVEGNVNHVHGLADWGVTIALMRNRQPVIAVVHQPINGLTWTALAGGGARCNGQLLQIGHKRRLEAAIAVTGQAEAGQSGTYAAIGDSITKMLYHALLVRTSVPSTFPLLQVAGGQADIFWQYSPVLLGIAAGMLIAREAGAVVSRIDGSAWEPGAEDILVTTPALQVQVIGVLAASRQGEAA